MTTSGESDAHPTPNRLSTASSPYLLQHAMNPVDWFPWGEEAFETARAEDKPIFLSIGYATCHWCHVMAHESFEDPTIAALLNDGFISIKLDREERPDVDSVYMTVCQLMTGQGGWPLTIVMTPDKQPFFAGTYFPRETRHGRIGMLDLLPRLRGLWDERRSDLEESAAAAVAAVREIEVRSSVRSADKLGEDVLRRGFSELEARFDDHQGGFGNAPKFPTPHNLLFLSRWHERTGERRPLEMIEKTLGAMRRGGVFDHVGYGFHRYSTDSRWLLPHFEKMLYDQALLAIAYTETWEITRDDRYRRVVEEILAYVTRDLTDEAGGFFSAEDADSEGREGAFYVWTREDFDAAVIPVLGVEEAAFARDAFGIESRGNFADEATGEMTGENIPYRRASVAALAEAAAEGTEDVLRRLERVRKVLFEARAPRPRPLLDDKVLTDWNGLMIAAFAIAGRSLEEPRYVDAAATAAEFILDRLHGETGLLHRYRDGDAGIPAGASDYAFLIWGLLELYSATFDPRWLETSNRLATELVDRFWDEENGGVFTSAADADDIIVRQREIYDGATPSANATTWYILLRLAQLTGSTEWSDRAAAVERAFAGTVAQRPSVHTMSLVALDLALGPSNEVVIAGDRDGADTHRLLAALRSEFRPRTGVLLRPSDPTEAARIDELAPFASGQESVDGVAVAYVCTDFACQFPTSDASEMLTRLT
ncbi:MAG: thioredoxin domain-containing protein [Gemmatimonadota bacterium]